MNHLGIGMTLVEQVGLVRRALYRVLTQRLAEKTSLPLQQLSALNVIAQGAARTQVELARCLLVDAPAASRLVDRLEAEGLLERRAGLDRRSVRLALTSRGRTALATLMTEVDGLDRELRHHLGPSGAKALASLLGKIECGIKEFGDRPPREEPRPTAAPPAAAARGSRPRAR